ncbi:MAG: nucleotidyl transferase AbiEii/AbiGii toxin family protein [Marinoscillum sp.]|uniref:nucleotidyl transferase AbiEii/AbiGii toxin family protein n=1 Tax=Marinoscillum sp. TaxID=2024838 RepID=UPI0032F0A560
MIDPRYRSQVDLLLSIIPLVAREKQLALKGGTAINLFVRDLPRLSVDLDLHYIGFEDRETALSNIHQIVERLSVKITQAIPGIRVQPVAGGDGLDVKLNCQLAGAQVKVEINMTTRGVLYPVKTLTVTDRVQEEFSKFAAMPVVSFAELYGGKICAALDRQHPRDLFDVYLLLKNGGITDEMKNAVLAFTLSHRRTIHDVLFPNYLDQRQAYDQQFQGMSTIPFSYADYEQTRIELISTMHQLITDQDKTFLLSFKNCEPEWNLFPEENIRNLPALKWKLQNLQNLKASNPVKHRAMLKELAEKLESIG